MTRSTTMFPPGKSQSITDVPGGGTSFSAPDALPLDTAIAHDVAAVAQVARN
ncbi:MAG: hypothetical protein ABIK89_20395 [Planctomycetota bacterium]